MGLDYGLSCLATHKSMGAGKSARAFVLISEAKNLGVSQTRAEFMFSSSETRSYRYLSDPHSNRNQ